MSEYKKEIFILSICFVMCIISFSFVKEKFFSSEKITNPVKSLINSSSNNLSNGYKEAVTVPIDNQVVITRASSNDSFELLSSESNIEYPYSIAPSFDDDGSIIYEGLTLTELTDKLNKSLPHYLTNTGYYFANYTKNTGLDPYLAVSIVLLETGCKWGCSSLTVNCNNIGGLKGGNSCNGGSYRRYNTLGEGIDGFLDIIYKNYYLKGLTTPEQMAPYYAQSTLWADKVNNYINEVKAK